MEAKLIILIAYINQPHPHDIQLPLGYKVHTFYRLIGCVHIASVDIELLW